jgi:hypothetical protein
MDAGGAEGRRGAGAERTGVKIGLVSSVGAGAGDGCRAASCQPTRSLRRLSIRCVRFARVGTLSCAYASWDLLALASNAGWGVEAVCFVYPPRPRAASTAARTPYRSEGIFRRRWAARSQAAYHDAKRGIC